MFKLVSEQWKRLINASEMPLPVADDLAKRVAIAYILAMPTLADPPAACILDEIARLNDALDAMVRMLRPTNLHIATWYIPNFGSLTREWFPSGAYNSARDPRALLAIPENH